MKNNKSNSSKAYKKGKRATNTSGYNDRDDSAKEESTYNGKSRHLKLDATACNDISWYVNNPQILKDVASLNFSNVLDPNGLPMSNSNNTHNLYKAGIMTIPLVPTIGSSGLAKPTDPINVAAKSIYAFVRHANSGHSNYDSPDLMMYLLALDNAYMLWSHMVRAYGIARTYSFQNKYYPDTILKSMGFDPDEVRKNLSNFRYFINDLAIKMSSFAVPTTIPYFKRHLWLYQNLFLDQRGSKSQTYLFVPAGYYSYTEGAVGKPNYLKWNAFSYISIPGNTMPLSDWYTAANASWSNLIGSEDIGIMSGDILKAYGPGNIYSFQSIPEDYSILPTVADAISSQIHNMTWYSAVESTISDITQIITEDPTNIANGCLSQNNNLSGGFGEHDLLLINMYDNNTTPEDVMYATRLTSYCTSKKNVCGSEVALTPLMWVGSSTGQSRVIEYSPVNHYVSLTSNPTIENVYIEAMDTIQQMYYASQFDWAPHWGGNINLGGSYPKYDDFYFGELQNFTTIDRDVLERIHAAAISAMFGLPYSMYQA